MLSTMAACSVLVSGSIAWAWADAKTWVNMAPCHSDAIPRGRDGCSEATSNEERLRAVARHLAAHLMFLCLCEWPCSREVPVIKRLLLGVAFSANTGQQRVCCPTR